MKKRKQAPPSSNAVIYVRVSTQEQVGNLSLDTQEEKCRHLCVQQGWKILRIFREEGQSAKTTRRDQFQNMLAYCKERKNGVGHIVAYDLSRFARNMMDQLTTEKDLLTAGVQLDSVQEPLLNTPEGRWFRNVKASTNQYENEVKGQRTIIAMSHAARIGRFPFKAPIGYINVSQHKGHNLIPDPNTAPLVSKAFEIAATGQMPKTQILSQLNGLGLRTRRGKPLTLQSFDRMLQNPIYAGWVRIPSWDLKARGSFEPLVSEELFNQVQDVLQGRSVTVSSYTRNNPDFPLRLFVRCGRCGEPLTGAWSSGRRKKYPYYRCRRSRCTLGNIARDRLEAEFIALLRRLTPAPEAVAGFEATVRQEWNRRQGDSEAAYRAIQHQLALVRERKNKLVDMRLDGEIDLASYKEQDVRLASLIDSED